MLSKPLTCLTFTTRNPFTALLFSQCVHSSWIFSPPNLTLPSAYSPAHLSTKSPFLNTELLFLMDSLGPPPGRCPRSTSHIPHSKENASSPLDCCLKFSHPFHYKYKSETQGALELFPFSHQWPKTTSPSLDALTSEVTLTKPPKCPIFCNEMHYLPQSNVFFYCSKIQNKDNKKEN